MSASAAVQYYVVLRKDPETGSVVAEIPALQLADYGADVPETLDCLQAMLSFHLDCLREEGKSFPSDRDDQEGLFLHVNLPAHVS